MEVILNAVLLRGRLTGIGQYTLRLAEGLERHPDVSLVRYFQLFWFGSSIPSSLPDRGWEPVRNRAKKVPFVLPIFSSVRGLCFRALSAWNGPAVYHEPNYLLLPYNGPTVATIHDLSYLHYPQYHPIERVRRMERGMPLTLARAGHLVTDSEFVRSEIISRFGVAPERVTAIPLGVEPVYRPRTMEECGVVLRRYRLEGGRYLLSVSALEPRKNLEGLVDAYSRLPSEIRKRFPLVLTGPKGWLSESLEERVAPLAQSGEVIQTGFVSAEDLPFLYSAAAGFASPSFYEGFGLPVLEAMASGTPVLTSSRGSLPEVAGDVGLLVDPEDVPAMTAGLERLLTDETFRERARREGPRRAAGFTWGKCVDRTVDVYRKVV